MGKRSNFRRRPMDNYATPHKPVVTLLAHLVADRISTFAEPCCGAGALVDHLTYYNYRCVLQTDIRQGIDALDLGPADFRDADAIITNPPWTLDLLQPLIGHFVSMERPVWLLMSADWPHLVASAGLLPFCSLIVPIGRVRWMPGTRDTSKDNVAWYRFHADHHGGPIFVPRIAGETVSVIRMEAAA